MEKFVILEILNTYLVNMINYKISSHKFKSFKENKNIWFYTDSKNDDLKYQEKDIIIKTILTSCFHGVTLLETPLNNITKPCISMQYLLSPDKNNISNTYFNQSNKPIYSPQNIYVQRQGVVKDIQYMPMDRLLNYLEKFI